MRMTVRSPVSGVAVALTDVPDQVFAEALVGPGVAVAPELVPADVLAPISGRIAKLHPHAFVVVGVRAARRRGRRHSRGYADRAVGSGRGRRRRTLDCRPWHPAVLNLLAMTLGAARAAGKPAGVCGEAAAHPLLARVLVGLGADSLSMSRTAFADALAATALAECSAVAHCVLQAPDAAAARASALLPAGAR